MTRFSQSNQALSIGFWHYLSIGIAFALGNWLVVPCARAQNAAAEAPRYIATSLQADRNTQPQGLYLEGITLSPYSRARAGVPFTLYCLVRNTSTTARALVAVAKVDGAPEFQAATYVEVPARQQRSVELRLRMPAQVREAGIGFTISLNDPENPSQVLLGPANTPLIDTIRVNVSDEMLVTALVMNAPDPIAPEWTYPQSDVVMEYELAIASRIDSSLSRRTLTIDHENMPTQAADWHSFDEIVISNDRPFQDPAVVDAFNQWVASGGRAWILLDQIAPSNMRKILSDGMSCELLDDIDLHHFVVESSAFGKLDVADRSVDSEKPIHFRRVLQRGGEVSLSIDKFPVAIWYRVGKGIVLVTTLEPEGFLQPRTFRRRSGDEYYSNFQMRTWAGALADRFHEAIVLVSPIESAEVQYPLQQIGNPVLARGYVLGVVFGFCALLSVAAVVCWLTNQMTRLVWLVPLISTFATVPLIIAALYQQKDIPDSSAHLQLIEVQPGSQTIQALQWTATYMRNADNTKLVADGNAMVWWPNNTKQQDLRRWTWLDYGKWELSSSGWPSGLWQINSRYTLPKKQLDAHAFIDDRGLHVQLPRELGEPLTDAVVQFNRGDPIPCGTFDQNAHVLIPELHLSQLDSWLTGSMVSDEQRRREQVYRQLHASGRQLGYPSYPAVIGWTKLWPAPVLWNQVRETRGSALVLLPIQLQPTASGQRVHVPHSVIKVENVGSSGLLSTAFSNASGWWAEESTASAQVGLRCSLPEQVCPIKASEITCTLQMRAPQRSVKVSALLSNGEKQLLQEFVSPSGTQTLRITDPELLKGISDGAIDFNLVVSPETNQSKVDFSHQQALWRVDYFRISVDGQVVER